MKPYLTLGLFYILGWLLNSCQGKIEFIRPDFPEKLCPVAILNSDGTNRSIIFEKSFQREYPDEYLDSIRGLEFKITTNNNLIYNYQSESSHPRKFTFNLPDSLVFVPGEKYSFWSKEINTGEISSEVIVPKSPSEFSVKFEGKALTVLPSPYECHSPVNSAILDISFATEKNSFYCVVIEDYRDRFIEYKIIESNSPNFSAIVPNMNRSDYYPCILGQAFIPTTDYYMNLFDGNTIPDGTCNLKIKIDLHLSLFNYKEPIKVRLNSIPMELYLFEKSLYTYMNSIHDPFSEPVYINGNIKGGNGIFAICSSSSISLTLPWETIF
jgi:hypothetical protein